MYQKMNRPRANTNDMVNVELHRAGSIVNESIDFIEPEPKSPNGRQSTFIYIRIKAAYAWSEMKDLKIEVVMFMYMFSYVLRSLSSVSMIMDKVCLVHLENSHEVCENLGKYPEVKSQVEKLANNYNLAHSMIHNIPAAVLSCFISSWSDKYGRKLPIIVAMVGIILDGLGTVVCSMAFYSRVEFYLIPAVFTGFSGGFVIVLTVLYSYAADITPVEKRTMKYTIMEVTFGLAMPLGQLAGGWLFKISGYFPVFMLSVSGHIFSLGWVLFVLKETKGFEYTENWFWKFKQLWSFAAVKESFKATVKLRPNKGRAQILLLIAAMSVAYLNLAASSYIGYLYVHHVYNWENTEYSTVSAVFSVVGTVAMLLAVPLMRRLRMGDPALGIIGTISSIARTLGTGSATKKGVYYLANLAGLLSGLASLAARSRISKVVSKNEIGKIFGFVTTAEFILPILSSAVVTQMFNATIDVYPGLTYIVIGSLLFIPLGVFVWMARLPAIDYEEMHKTEEQTSSDDTNAKY